MTANDVRRIALSLPEAEERETWGEATFRVRDRIFVMLGPDGRRAGVKASVDDQAALVEAQEHGAGGMGSFRSPMSSGIVHTEVVRRVCVAASGRVG
jgi:YjbR